MRGHDGTPESDCFAFTESHHNTEIFRIHVFRCQIREAVRSRRFLSSSGSGSRDTLVLFSQWCSTAEVSSRPRVLVSSCPFKYQDGVNMKLLPFPEWPEGGAKAPLPTLGFSLVNFSAREHEGSLGL